MTDAKVRIQVDATAAKSIVERKGLSKVRHLDTAALWIQEQQVRRILPLTKIPGTKNEADLMTKNLDVAQVEMYIDLLQMEFAVGRAVGAAQLHSITEPRSLTSVMSPGRFPSSRLTSQEKAKLMCTYTNNYNGGHDYNNDDSTGKEPIESDDVGSTRGRAHDNITPHTPTQRPDESKDKWECRGQSGLWKRRHQGWRHEKFTPLRIPRGPTKGAELARYRRTDGEFEDGTTFTIVDDWCNPKKAHELIRMKWRGTTSFIQIKQGSFPGELNSGFNECRDLLSCAPATAVELDNRGQSIAEEDVESHIRDSRRVSFA